jgi:hypothetical protein
MDHGVKGGEFDQFHKWSASGFFSAPSKWTDFERSSSFNTRVRSSGGSRGEREAERITSQREDRGINFASQGCSQGGRGR